MGRPPLDPKVIASIDRTFGEATDKLNVMLTELRANTLAARMNGEDAELDSVAFYDLYKAMVSLIPPSTMPYVAAIAIIKLLEAQLDESDD